MSTTWLLIGTIAAAAAISVLLVISRLPDRRKIFAFLVGASAGLQIVQVDHVHLFTILTVIYGAGTGWRRNDRSPGWRAVLLMVGVALLAVTVLTGDLVNNRNLALQLILLAGSACIIAMIASDQDQRIMCFGLLAITTLGAAVGVLQSLDVLPIVPNDLQRPTGIYTEPDWLGLYSAIGLLLAIRLGIRNRAVLLIAIIDVAALILASARAAWLALVLSTLVMLVIRRIVWSRDVIAGGRQRRNAWLLLVLVAFAGALLWASPTLRTSLVTRIQGLSPDSTDISATARVQQNRGLMELAATEPWYGHGLSASGRVGVSGIIFFGPGAPNNVASDWVVGWWVDGGYLALPLMATLILLALSRAHTISGQILVLVLVNNLISDATFLPVTWFAIALCLSPPSRVLIRESQPAAV